ncbi:hypothetical protein YC2023_076984 [Brassica napus]|uniref:Uncharacterized protein n=1 Tax=Brassica oleracea TaxID=3712 RepID=A0A3P6FT09_BRAOL|nr:unnamed protein product [Brassica oleracea]
MTGKKQLMDTRNQRRRKSSLHSELQAFVWAAQNMFVTQLARTSEWTAKT